MKRIVLIAIGLLLLCIGIVYACHGSPMLTVHGELEVKIFGYYTINLYDVDMAVTKPVEDFYSTYTEYTIIEDAPMPEGYTNDTVLDKVKVKFGRISWEGYEGIPRLPLIFVDYFLVVPVQDMGEVSGTTLILDKAIIYPLDEPYCCTE